MPICFTSLKGKMCFEAFSWVFCLQVKYSQIFVAAGPYCALLYLCSINFLAPNTKILRYL